MKTAVDCYDFYDRVFPECGLFDLTDGLCHGDPTMSCERAQENQITYLGSLGSRRGKENPNPCELWRAFCGISILYGTIPSRPLFHGGLGLPALGIHTFQERFGCTSGPDCSSSRSL
jgi:hypothetical protein